MVLDTATVGAVGSKYLRAEGYEKNKRMQHNLLQLERKGGYIAKIKIICCKITCSGN